PLSKLMLPLRWPSTLMPWSRLDWKWPSNVDPSAIRLVMALRRSDGTRRDGVGWAFMGSGLLACGGWFGMEGGTGLGGGDDPGHHRGGCDEHQQQGQAVTPESPGEPAQHHAAARHLLVAGPAGAQGRLSKGLGVGACAARNHPG